MTETPESLNWIDANQCYLQEALLAVRFKLEQYIEKNNLKVQKERQDQGNISERNVLINAACEMPAPPAFETLCKIFGLSSFERDILLLCAGIELDSTFVLLCAQAQGDSARKYPTFSLALAALTEPHWDALTPASPLRRWNLIEVKSVSSLLSGPLQIDERVLHYLLGVHYLDERLTGFVEPMIVQKEHELVPSHRAVADQIIRTWSLVANTTALPVIQLCGSESVIKKEILVSACDTLGLTLNKVAANFLPTDPVELDSLTRLLERELALEGGALFLDCDDVDSADQTYEKSINKLIDCISGPLIVCSRDRRNIRKRPVIFFDVRKPNTDEQKELWKHVLRTEVYDLDNIAGELVSQFNFNAQTIQNACIEALSHSSLDESCVPVNEKTYYEEILPQLLWDACRTQARPKLENLAQRIEPAVSLDDLVLPESQKATLEEIKTHFRQRDKVYGNWGFAAKSSRGLGITALFSGASGTGKTMAAEALAKKLKLDLYRIDLSQVVSKYIGETEKNLRQIFDAAEEGGAILLFDEADALFGKRSEVRDSHDRYANIEVSYLLQRMEAYRGLAILTTNMKNALDPAFLRRIRFVVHFPFPDAEQRAKIWEGIFPKENITKGLDYNKLAHLNVTGGSIYNIALSAAFLAADKGELVQMKHILQASWAEYAKLERTLTDAEIEGWI